MSKKIEEPKEETFEERKEQKETSTAFLMMFPALIIAILGLAYAPVWAALVIIALVIYQFLMLKKFIEDYYKRQL